MKYILALVGISSFICIQSRPVNAISTNFYNGLGLPEDNSPQWLAPGAIDSSGVPTIFSGTAVAGGVEVDSNANSAEYSGYSNYDPLNSGFVNSNFPALDATNGYDIFFNVALNTVDDFSDTSNNRAAFSITVISADKRGIEIGFDKDRIFAQEGNFTQVATETTVFDTSNITDYKLAVLGNNYELQADNGSGFSSIISGSLRTYNFDPLSSNPPLGTFNPYDTANFLFLGDNTGQAHGTFTLGAISATTTTVPFNFSPTLGLALIGIGVGVKKIHSQRSL